MSMNKEECQALFNELWDSKPEQGETNKDQITYWLERSFHVYAMLKSLTPLQVEPAWHLCYLWRLWGVASVEGKGIVNDEVREHVVIFDDQLQDWAQAQIALLLERKTMNSQIEKHYHLLSTAKREGYEGAETLEEVTLAPTEELIEKHELKIWPSRPELECAGLKKSLSQKNLGIVLRCINNKDWTTDTDFLLKKGKTMAEVVDSALNDLNAPWEETGWKIASRRRNRILLGAAKKRASRKSLEASKKKPSNAPVT